MASDMKTSKNGRAFITGLEGLRLTAYKDGGGIPTIGVGHTQDVYPGMTITAEMADLYLSMDLMKSEKVINTYVKVKLNQNQFDSLVSFVFNVGGNAFRKSTLLKRINSFAIDSEVVAEFMRWNKDNGKVVAGLTKRRKAEAELFMKPIN